MSKKFSAPSLAEITYEYLGLHKRRSLAADYASLERQFTSALQRVRSADEIRAALALDSARALPVQLKSPAYERLLALEGRSIRLLREYAQEMYEYGPDFLPYADRLWDEANELEEEQEH